MAPARDYTLIEDDLTLRDDETEVMQCIKKLLREQVRPMVQRDGGDVKLLYLNEVTGVVPLAMFGAYRSCPPTENTLKGGVERLMKHFLLEVSEVVEAKGHQFYEDYGLVLGWEAVLYKEAARVDDQRRWAMRLNLTPTTMSYGALSEPDGDGWHSLW